MKPRARWNHGGPDFLQVDRDGYCDRVGDVTLPALMRLEAAALCGLVDNGLHVRFDPGELAWLLHTADRQTGELRPMDDSQLRRTIRTAVGSGLLLPGSLVRCLIVSPGLVLSTGGRSVGPPCPLAAEHERTAAGVGGRPSGSRTRSRSPRVLLRLVASGATA